MLTASVDHPVERSLAGVEACLDPLTVLQACKAGVLRVDANVRDAWREARMIEAFYHPQRYLRVAYAMLADVDTPANRFWPEGDVVYIHTPVREPMSRRGDCFSIGDASVETYSFPNDRRLRGLRTFAKRDLCAETWQNWVERNGDRTTIDSGSLQRLLVRYVPENRWIVRLRAEFSAANSSKPEKRRIAVRASSSDATAKLLARHQALSERRDACDDSFRTPEVVGWDIEGGLLASEWIRGDTVLDALRGGDSSSVLGRIAVGLRALHHTSVAGLEPITAETLASRAGDAIDDLRLACPKLERDLTELSARLLRSLGELGPVGGVTLHNDFHWKQLSIKRDRYAMLDFDRMAIGDELIDVANFATQLQMLGQRPEYSVDSEESERWRTAFIEQWQQAASVQMDRMRLGCYAAISRLELARGMMRHLRPGWLRLAKRCIEITRSELDSTCSGGSS